MVVQLLLFAAIALVPGDLLPAWPAWLREIALVAGVVVGVAGLALAGVSAQQLGGNLTAFPKPKDDGTLVTNGVYALVRHPIYSGVLLAALGLALVRGSTPSLLLAIGLAIFFDMKSRREEQWLARKFPEYAAYQARVKKLVPWVY